MFSIASNSGKTAYGVTRFLVDTVDDIASLPTYHTPGSVAFVIENSSKWVLNNKHKWKKTASSSSGGSSTDILYKTTDFICSFDENGMLAGSLETDDEDIKESTLNGNSVVDITDLVEFLGGTLNSVDSITVDLKTTNGNGSPQVALYADSNKLSSAVFSSKAASVTGNVPDTGATAITLLLSDFETNIDIPFILKVSVTIAGTEETYDEVIYDGGSIV